MYVYARSNRAKFHQFLAYRNFPPQQAVYINPLAVDAFAVQRVAARGGIEEQEEAMAAAVGRSRTTARWKKKKCLARYLRNFLVTP